MKYPYPLVPAVFICRPNRFGVIAVVEGREEYVHLPDPGRLREILVPGADLWLAPAPEGRRRTHYTVALARSDSQLVSLDTQLATRLVRAALLEGSIPELRGYRQVAPEVRWGQSRFDFLLRGKGTPCLVEVKSVTLVEEGVGLFPDAVTARGARHLRELVAAHQRGYRCVVLFVAQRGDVRAVAPHEANDPSFATALRSAYGSGVELMAYTCQVTLSEVKLDKPIPVWLNRRIYP